MLRQAIGSGVRGTGRRVAARSFASTTRLSSDAPSSGVTPAQRELEYRHEALERKMGSPKTSDEEAMIGDYPNLPFVSYQHRPQKGWWDNWERRNFGETLPEEEDALSVWAPDIPQANIDPGMAVRHLGIMAIVIASFAFILSSTKPEKIAAERTYPYDGLVKEFGGEGTIHHANKEEQS